MVPFQPFTLAVNKWSAAPGIQLGTKTDVFAPWKLPLRAGEQSYGDVNRQLSLKQLTTVILIDQAEGIRSPGRDGHSLVTERNHGTGGED